MSLDLALNNAVSGLRAAQTSLAVISQNVANANDPDHMRQVVSQGAVYIDNTPAGTRVESVRRSVDVFLQRELRVRESAVGEAAAVKDFYDQLQLLLGQPGSDQTLAAYMDAFFTDLQALSNSPEELAVRTNVIDSAVTFARELSNLAEGIEKLRFQADEQIVEVVDSINEITERLYEVNLALNTAAALGDDSPGLLDERDALLEDLAVLTDMQVIFGRSGQAYVYIGDGKTLIQDDRYEMQYSPITSADAFIADVSLDSIELVPVNEAGNPIGEGTELVSGGTRGNIVSVVKGGKLKGLLDMRDKLLVETLDQFDNMAQGLLQAFNAIHNDGGSIPGMSTLTGTKQVTALDEQSWSGEVRIAVLEQDGSPPPVHYSTGEPGGFRPLTLDLSALDSGNGAGRITIDDILYEINHHFGAPQNKVSVGELNNIELVAVSDSIAGGTFQFDFELENLDNNDISFEVTGITVVDGGGGAPAGLSSALPGAYTTHGGDLVRTGDPISIDLTGGTGPNYTIQVDVEIIDSTGTPITATIEYDITDSVTGIKNHRYTVSGTTTPGTASIQTPIDNVAYLSADLVDENGSPVPDGEFGYLQLTAGSVDGKPLIIAFDEMTSQEGGLLNGDSSRDDSASERGFSHFFQLNDFFIEREEITGTALNFQVRSDIVTNPTRMVTGELSLSKQPSFPHDFAYYTYELGAGGNQVAQRLASLTTDPIDFEGVSGIDAVTKTITEYTATLIGITASKSISAVSNLTQQEELRDGFSTRFDATARVNIDEELAYSVVIQNAYAASARVISITDELFDALLAAF